MFTVISQFAAKTEKNEGHNLRNHFAWELVGSSSRTETVIKTLVQLQGWVSPPKTAADGADMLTHVTFSPCGAANRFAERDDRRPAEPEGYPESRQHVPCVRGLPVICLNNRMRQTL